MDKITCYQTKASHVMMKIGTSTLTPATLRVNILEDKLIIDKSFYSKTSVRNTVPKMSKFSDLLMKIVLSP